MRAMIVMLSAAGTLAACAQSPREIAQSQQRVAAEQAALANEFAGLVPQGTETCLNNFGNYTLKAYGPTLVYRVSNSLKFRSDTGGGCENVARGDILVTVSNQGRLCQGDIARTVQPTSRVPTGSCGIGTFTRYGKP